MLGEINESHGEFAKYEKHSQIAADSGHLGALIEVTNMRMSDNDCAAALSFSADIDAEFSPGYNVFVNRTKAT